jgi:hypothetical protein
MSCRFDHFGGRPALLPRGNKGSSTATARRRRLRLAAARGRQNLRHKQMILSFHDSSPETPLMPGP